MNYLNVRYPLDPAYRVLYRAVWECAEAAIAEGETAAYEILEELEDDEWEKEDLRAYLYVRRREMVQAMVMLREAEHIVN